MPTPRSQRFAGSVTPVLTQWGVNAVAKALCGAYRAELIRSHGPVHPEPSRILHAEWID